jgi:hypothetical protein
MGAMVTVVMEDEGYCPDSSNERQKLLFDHAVGVLAAELLQQNARTIRLVA